MSPVAQKVSAFTKLLVTEHVTSPKAVPYVPALNLLIDAATTAADVAIATEGLPALQTKLPAVAKYANVALEVLSAISTPAK